MPPSRANPGTPEDWLARARGDLALAAAPLPEGAFLEDLCYHAQQAAEKALKAVYLRHDWPFRYVHDIEELLVGLRRQGLSVPPDLDAAVELTEYAFAARYPGTQEEIVPEEHERAVDFARRVVRWAAEKVEGSVA